jgi:hypothetical protein
VLYKGIPLHENFGNCVIIATKVRWNIKVFVVDRISVFSDEGSLRNQSILVILLAQNPLCQDAKCGSPVKGISAQKGERAFYFVAAFYATGSGKVLIEVKCLYP